MSCNTAPEIAQGECAGRCRRRLTVGTAPCGTRRTSNRQLSSHIRPPGWATKESRLSLGADPGDSQRGSASLTEKAIALDSAHLAAVRSAATRGCLTGRGVPEIMQHWSTTARAAGGAQPKYTSRRMSAAQTREVAAQPVGDKRTHTRVQLSVDRRHATVGYATVGRLTYTSQRCKPGVCPGTRFRTRRASDSLPVSRRGS